MAAAAALDVRPAPAPAAFRPPAGATWRSRGPSAASSSSCRALLHDAAPLEHVDPVGVHDGGEPVRDEHRHHVAVARHLADGAGDLLLGERVERGGRLVEDQEVRPAQQRARDRQALLLAPRDLHPALADERVEAAVGPRQQALAGGALEHLQALGVGRAGLHEEQVLADRAREELRLLGDEADLLAQALEVDPVVGLAVVEDAARRSGGRARRGA